MLIDIVVVVDECICEESFIIKLFKRLEFGLIVGLILVIVFFLFIVDLLMFMFLGVLNFLILVVQLGIFVIVVVMFMIGGEFDLLIGLMVVFVGMIFGVLVVNFLLFLIVVILLIIVFFVMVGSINGVLIICIGLFLFIVMLVFLFVLCGLIFVGLKFLIGGLIQLCGVCDVVENDWLVFFFLGEVLGFFFCWLVENGMIEIFCLGVLKVVGILIEIFWFIVFVLGVIWVFFWIFVGNWIFVFGGDKNVGLIDVCCGFMKEFEVIIVVVIGGCLLIGGYGFVIGVFFGLIIFGMVVIGLIYMNID